MNLKRSVSRSLVIIGFIMIILGIIFILQSKSIFIYVGPPSSFMYSNPGWTVNGIIIIGIGILILLCGAIVFRISPK
jgi:uncharacterized membrane protein